MRAAALFAFAVMVACGGRGREPVARAAHRMAAETVVRTRSGASLLVAAGWWLTRTGDLILLEDPDRAIRAWFLESGEQDGARAIAAGWRRVAPGFAHPLEDEPDNPPPEGGWEAVTSAGYDAGRARVVEAQALRYRGVTHVVLVDGERAAVARRGAQLEQSIASLRPPGMREERLAGIAPQPIDSERARELDAFIGDAMARLAVPGAVVAVVQGEEVVYERAFGVRAIGGTDRVTPQTLFLIGSITKPMTTLMQAAQVDAGLFRWDTPVVDVLPSFALGDPELTRKVVMWHMSCACTGMPRNDLENIFEFGEVSAEARVASMRTMVPTTGLGETFQYSNLMVAAGGYAAAHAEAPERSLGDAYDLAMQRRVFAPIGMRSTTLDFGAALAAEHAVPHALAIDRKVRAVPIDMERNTVPIRPAGGVWSNARDMERYVMTEMAGGLAPGGTRVVSQANLEARRVVRIGGADDGYGLGLGVGRFHGLPVLSHDGGAFGYGTSMFMLPEQRIAIIVLTNIRNDVPGEYLPFNAVVKRAVVEAIFPGARPLAATTLRHFTRLAARAAARQVERLRQPPDRAWIASLAGRYTNPRLGEVVVKTAGDRISFDAGEWQSALGEGSGSGGARTLVFLDPPFAGAAIMVGGDPAKPTITVEDGQMTYRFIRR